MLFRLKAWSTFKNFWMICVLGTASSCSLKVVPRLASLSVQDSNTNPIPQLDFGSSTYRFAPNFAISLSPLTLDAGLAATVTNCVLDSSSPSLPAGITLDATTCTVSGTAVSNNPPTLYTVNVTNSVGNSTSDTVTIEISDAVPTLTYAPSTYFTALTTTPDFNFTINPVVFDAGNGRTFDHCAVNASTPLPAEYSLNPADCSLTGNGSTAMATDTYQIEMYNDLGDFSIGSITIGVYELPTLTITGTTQLMNGNVAFSYVPTISKDARLSITNCEDWSLLLPPSLTVNTATCEISGTPSLAESSSGSYLNASTTIRLTDSFGSMIDANFSFDLYSTPVIATFDVLNQGMTPDPTNDPNFNLQYTMSTGRNDEFCVIEGVGASISGCAWNATFPTTISTVDVDGSITYNLWVRDSFGRTSSQATASIVLDRAEAPPTSITLQGITSPNNQTTFLVNVGGTSVGQTVTLFDDAGCSSQIGSAAGTALTTDVSVTIAAVDATYNIYGTLTDAIGNVSACSTVHETYVLNTVQSIAAFTITSVVVNNATGPDALEVTWDPATGADSYDISWGTGGSPTGAGSAVGVTSPYVIGGLTSGTAYTILVTAKNAVGPGNSLDATSSVDGTPMNLPVISGVTQNGAQQLDVVWTDGTGATAFTVSYGTSSGAYGTTFSTSASSPTTINGLANATAYYVMITATNASGSLDAAVEGSATTLDVTSAPSNVVALAGSTSVDISWDAVTGADTYTVYRSTTAGSGYVALAACTTQVGITCTDLTASIGTTYYYIVRAVNGVGESADSAEVSARISSGASLSFTPGSYDFGNRVISGSPTKSFTVTNTGDLDATGINYTNFNSVFQDTGTGDCGATLAVSATCTLVVSFTPVAAVPYSRTVHVTYSDSILTSGNTSLSLTGTGQNGTPFISVWQTTGPSESITLPLRSGSQYNFAVDWGDGSNSVVTSDTDPDITHIYAAAGNYTVTITGYAEAWYFNAAGDSAKLLQVTDFGDLGWTNLEYAFAGCSSLVSFAGGNTVNVTNMSYMFYGVTSPATLDLSSFNTTNVTHVVGMFFGASGLTSLDLSNFNTINITDMSYMFYDANGLTSLDISSFNTTNVTNMSSMFHNNAALTSLDLSNFNTTNVTDMSAMFSSTNSLTSLDLSNFDTSNVTNMSAMFVGTFGLTSLDLSNFDTSNVTDMSLMFAVATGLTSLDLSNFNTSNVTNMSRMFEGSTGLTTVDLSSFNTSNVTNMSRMFYYATGLTSLDVSNFNTSNVTDMSYMFDYISGLTSLDLSNFNTAHVTNMSRMFYYATGLTSLDLSNFNTSNVTNMSEMFDGASNLTTLDVSNFNTSSVTTMYAMFGNTYGLTSLDLSSFTTSSVTSMRQMFRGTRLTTLDVSNFNTSNVTDMASMFAATYITSLDLSNFNTSSVTNMSGMFANSSSLTSLDLSSFNTSNVTDMTSMFYNSRGLTSLDLSNFNTSSVTNMSGMFRDTNSLASLNVMSWDISPPPTSTNIFLNANPALAVRCDQGGSPGTGTFFGKSCNP